MTRRRHFKAETLSPKALTIILSELTKGTTDAC